jgi:hypothetical protein
MSIEILGQYSDYCVRCGRKFAPGSDVDVLWQGQWTSKHKLTSPQNLTLVHARQCPTKGNEGGGDDEP